MNEEEEALEALMVAKQIKKKKKKTGGEGGENGDGAVRRKKKKKKKPSAAQLEDQIEADASNNGNYGEGVAVTAVANAMVNAETKGGYDKLDEDGGGGFVELTEKGGYHDHDSDDVIELEQERNMGNGHDVNNGDGEGRYGETLTADAAYTFEADTEIMAEINQEGLVQVDEAGGIQAFVAETIAIDGDAVGIIKSDAEVETEEKKKYTNYFCGAVFVLVVVIIAVAVPVTLKVAKGRQRTIVREITNDPTQVPSGMPSDVPSSMPSSTRFTQIVRKLTYLSGDALKVQGSPQYRAAMWMADDDPIKNIRTGGTGLDLDDNGFEQRYVMALFYYAMDGNLWKQSQGWLGEDSVCEWFGVKGSSDGCLTGCVVKSDNMGDYDKVCRIAMGKRNHLLGQLPSELSILTELRWFEIQDDYVKGTIPKSIGTSWTKVHTILLGDNFLYGGFPETFENNNILGTIFIDRNNFNSTFPNVVATMKNLKWLDAEHNNFSGTMPSTIGNLKYLRILNVNNNSMTGYLPDSWDENNLIEDFEVEDNNFKGKLPPSLAKTMYLKDFRASRNQLSGEIPEGYYQWENLEELYLDGNDMVGELPQSAVPFYSGLQELSIHSNGFSGRFPVEHFEDTFRIKVLSLHQNQLTGFITPSICARRDSSRSYTQLVTLTADCGDDKIKCDCCTCYENGELIEDAGS